MVPRIARHAIGIATAPIRVAALLDRFTVVMRAAQALQIVVVIASALVQRHDVVDLICGCRPALAGAHDAQRASRQQPAPTLLVRPATQRASTCHVRRPEGQSAFPRSRGEPPKSEKPARLLGRAYVSSVDTSACVMQAQRGRMSADW